MTEITQGTSNKVKIVLKLWMRLKNIENAVRNNKLKIILLELASVIFRT
jgi:hypothetical protein